MTRLFTQDAFIRTFVFILVLSTILYFSYRPLPGLVVPSSGEYAAASEIYFLYSYEDLDRQLCKKTIDWNKNSLFHPLTALKCPEYEDIVSIASGGRTGNLLWAYASVMAVAQQTGLKPYVPSCLKSSLEDLFENLSLPTFKNIIDCPVKINVFADSVDNWKINPRSIILPRYLIFKKEILPWIPTIRKEFTFKENLRISAQQTLKNLTQNLPANNYTFVGVHVRRTDYKYYLRRKYKEELASPTFFLNAMAYFKEKYPNPIFIFISDDPQWCVDQFANLENVFVVTDTRYKKNGAALDLAIMVSCNHTIYDYGTFGEWGAILAGGEVVCYDMVQNSKEGSLQYNKSWHLMN